MCLIMAKAKMEFTSNLPEAKQRLQNAQRAGLLAALLIIERHAKHYSLVRDGATRDSYTHEIGTDGAELVGAVGSDSMVAVYNEFGTGEFAEKGDGRKGGWVYFDPKEGEYFFTYGQKPNKTLRRAASVSRSDIEQIIGEHYREVF